MQERRLGTVCGDPLGGEHVQLVRRDAGGGVLAHGGQHGADHVAGGGDGIHLAGGLQLDHADNNTGIRMTGMVRVPLTPADRERGERLGLLLREARGERSIGEVALAAGISPETLRKIETGRIPTPAFFTVAALAVELQLPLDRIVTATEPAQGRATA